MGGQSSKTLLVVEKVPNSPAHWLDRTGTSIREAASIREAGQPEIGVARMRAKVSKMVLFRDSFLLARACRREDLKWSFESQG